MKSKVPIRFHLQFKLVLATAVAIAFLTTVLILYYNRHIENDARNALVHRSISIAVGMATEAEFGLLAGNKDLLQRSIKAALEEADVLYVRVSDATGHVVVSGGDMPSGSSSYLDSRVVAAAQGRLMTTEVTDPRRGAVQMVYMPIKQPSSQGGQQSIFGFIELCVSPHSTLEQVDKARRAALLMGIISALAASTLCVVVVRRAVNPLRELVLGTQQLAQGKLDTRVAADRGDEIGELGAAFNQMAASLEQSRQVILNHQRNLEDRVAERTSELRESRDFFNAIIAESPMAMWILDAHGNALLCNKALRSIFSVPQTEEETPPVYNILEDTELRDRGSLSAVQRVFEQGQTVRFSSLYDPWRANHLWTASARPLFIDFTLFPLRDQSGHVKNVVAILIDLTQQRQIEGQLRQAEKMAAVGQLGAGVAHEINNPMTSILGHTQLMLLKAPAEHPFRRALQIVEREAQRCSQIVLSLLTYSRPAGDTMELRQAQTMIDAAVDLMSHQASLRRVSLFLSCPPNLPVVKINENQMQQVMINVIANALDVMPEGGEIHIRAAAEEGKCLRIRIADSGPGIPEKNLDRIFEPFFTTKENWRGTGLGLTVCYKIVQDHGGRIFARNRPEGGAEFTVELPLPN